MSRCKPTRKSPPIREKLVLQRLKPGLSVLGCLPSALLELGCSLGESFISLKKKKTTIAAAEEVSKGSSIREKKNHVPSTVNQSNQTLTKTKCLTSSPLSPASPSSPEEP